MRLQVLEFWGRAATRIPNLIVFLIVSVENAKRRRKYLSDLSHLDLQERDGASRIFAAMGISDEHRELVCAIFCALRSAVIVSGIVSLALALTRRHCNEK